MNIDKNIYNNRRVTGVAITTPITSSQSQAWTHEYRELSQIPPQVKKYIDKINLLQKEYNQNEIEMKEKPDQEYLFTKRKNIVDKIKRTEEKLQKYCELNINKSGSTSKYSKQQASEHMTIEHGSLLAINSNRNFQINALQRALHIDLNLDPLTSNENKKKILFNEMKQVSEKDIAKIIQQNKRYPLMKSFINALSENYNNLSDITAEELLCVIKSQHKNLLMFSKIMETLENDGRSNLMQLTLLDESIENLLHSFVDGTLVIGESEALKIMSVLNSIIEEDVKNSDTPLSEKGLEKKRKEDPISKGAIIAQAELFSAERAAKIMTLSTKKISPLGTSQNKVFHLDKAFFKTTPEGDVAGAIMEKLLWDIALLLGVEDNFTATKISSIQTAKGRSIKGGIQAEQANGKTLANYVEFLENKREEEGAIGKKKEMIAKQEVILATVIQYAFGMFDAHLNNILLDEKSGKLKFFDNTRSMPHTNGVIQNDSYLLPAFRSGLFALDASYEPLTKVEREQMQEAIEKIRSRIKDVENFLSNPLEQKQLQRLPPGWWNSEQSLAAFKERVNSLSWAIKNDTALNLRDIIFLADPDVKFFAALETIKLKIDHPFASDLEVQKIALSLIGTTSVDKLIKKNISKGVDVAEVQRLCQDPSLDFSDIVTISINKAIDTVHIIKSKEERNLRIISGKNIIAKYRTQASIDSKDLSRAESKIIAYNKVMQLFLLNNIKILKESEGLDLMVRNKPYRNIVIKEPGNDRALSIIYKNVRNRLVKIPLNYFSSVGTVSVDNSQVIMRNINQDEAEDRLTKCPPGSFLFRPSSSAEFISTSFVTEDGEVMHASFSMKDNKFADADEEFNSLEEIVAKYTDIFKLAAPLLPTDLLF